VIKSARGKHGAIVTEFGQLVVAPLSYSEPVTVDLNVINQAFNIIAPVTGKRAVITDIIVSADNSVSPTAPANIEVYESDSGESLTIEKSILSPRLVRAGNLTLTGLNMITTEGQWVNAKTDDNNVTITIMFYTVPKD
jgi:hypothetical protein